ncbi:MAG: phosphoserine phosphatase SerB [Micropepsaceae bacterium]
MNHTLVLTAALGELHDDAVTVAAKVLDGTPHWLSPGTACDFPVIEPAVVASVRTALAGHNVDANVVPNTYRRKRLLIADMDSTIIGCECIDEIADYAGVKPQIAAITERAMRGEIPFESALRERVALLKGLPEKTLARVYAERVRLNDGARILVRTMSEAGAKTALVSGGFTFFTSRVADAAGFATNKANELDIEDGKLSGTVREPILGREAKLRSLVALAHDLGMITAAGLGIADRAKPVVAEVAHARLDHSDLSAALYLQGYRETELVLD